MELIDKDALVAEIERRKEVVDDPIILDNDLIIGERNAYIRLLSFINTLEVKEVDLEEKATQLSQKYFPDEENIWARPNIEAQRCKNACIEMVEWFKAQKGEGV